MIACCDRQALASPDNDIHKQWRHSTKNTSTDVTRQKIYETQPNERKTLPPTKDSPRRRDKSDWEAVEKRVRTLAAGCGRGRPPTRDKRNYKCVSTCGGVSCVMTVTRLALHPREHARTLDVVDDRVSTKRVRSAEDRCPPNHCI